MVDQTTAEESPASERMRLPEGRRVTEESFPLTGLSRLAVQTTAVGDWEYQTANMKALSPTAENVESGEVMTSWGFSTEREKALDEEEKWKEKLKKRRRWKMMWTCIVAMFNLWL